MFQVRRWIAGRPERWMYHVLIFVADILEDVIWKPKPRPLLETSDIVHLDDEELRRRAAAGPPLQDSSREFGAFSTFVLDDKIVAKFTLDMFHEDPNLNREVMAMRLVWEHTTIPLPRVHRVLRADDWTTIVMDFIEGERLDRAWPKLSLWARLNIAWTLRSYVRQLRRIPIPPPPFPGPVGSEPSPCGGLGLSPVHWYSDELTFNTTEELLTKFKMTAERRFRQHNHKEPQRYPEIEDPGPLVFTHHDLNMRNVILGKDGTVWLLDWDFSGYFPRYFEYLGMHYAAERARARLGEQTFAYFIPFITDPYFPIRAWLSGADPYGSMY